MHFDAAGMAIAQLKSGADGRCQLLACDYIAADAQSTRSQQLTDAVKKLGLQGAAVNLVLPSSKYSLLMVEPPQVPDEEMKEALRWRIKDLVDFDVGSAAVDFFRIPEEAFRGRAAMVYVVAAQRAVLTEAQSLVAESGLLLKYVDAAQLAIGNLSAHWAMEGQSMATLYLAPGEGVITLAREDMLYLARGVQAKIGNLLASGIARDDAFNTLVLEIQRSMDYYESQLGQAPASRVLLMPMEAGDADLSEELSRYLGIKMDVAELAEHIDGLEAVDSTLLPKCLLAIAGAMRQESA